MKILIVEDNPVNYRMLQVLLEQYGEIEIAVNGRAGLAAFERAHQKNSPIELIFLDIVMPEMDGHEVLERIRALERGKGLVTEEQQVKVVMSTSQDRTDSYFLKPYNALELEDLMDQMGFSKVNPLP